MIIRKDQPPAEHGTDGRAEQYGAFERLRYSDVGGLTQFGAAVETLQPGSRSSERHWHEAEDEFLYVISGEATVVEEDGAHLLYPGDAACWPAGAVNAHQVGTLMAHEVIHYPDVEEVGYIEGETRRLHRTEDGSLIMEGKTEQVRPLTWRKPEANRAP
jgi:uncharacterized cupin superfamily protein